MKTDDSGIVVENETTTNSVDSKQWSHKREQSMQSFGGDSVREMAEEILDNLYDSLTTEESKSKNRLFFFRAVFLNLYGMRFDVL